MCAEKAEEIRMQEAELIGKDSICSLEEKATTVASKAWKEQRHMGAHTREPKSAAQLRAT